MANNIEKGHIVAFTRYMIVTDPPGKWDTNRILVNDLHDDSGKGIQIRGEVLLQKLYSTDDYAETEKVTKTRLAELLSEAGVKPFTVHYLTADNNERTLRGRLIGAEPMMGRSQVEDLDIPLDDPKGRFRLVDHRTIDWLIIDNVRYERK